MIGVVPATPYSYLWSLVGGDARTQPGWAAAWTVARDYNYHHLSTGTRGTMRWHLAGASMTIWVTRHWNEDELIAWGAKRWPRGWPGCRIGPSKS
jgi:hypothetical protein